MFKRLQAEAPELFAPGAKRKSDFFRDIAGSRYLAIGETVAKEMGMRYDMVLNVFDRSIIEVENRVYADAMTTNLMRALERTFKGMPETAGRADAIRAPIQGVLDTPLEESYVIGTGYGRARLPFSKEHIRSEILCHGLGAHVMYPGTATVLDIGGQDTKAIQVDPHGIVESFQMNDRCAAGCGRYLGYIADEMNMGLHELGPLAMKATKNVRINSTCTVFAGAELRDRLSLGEKREDIMLGLHRAIILRAMSILARSGGVRNEFTFTGGVAKNEAAVKSLKELVRENYGEVKLNIDPDSIYTGALGGATFAWRAVVEEGKTAEARSMNIDGGDIMTISVGIDIGSGVVKTALFRTEGGKSEWLARRVERIRQRDNMQLAKAGYDEVLEEAGLKPADVDYVATTGEGENVKFATGHFYSMTTHARGAIFLNPEARGVVDIGALNGRAIYVDERGKVLAYKMTSQCASGSGQFLENIARYLGVAVEEIGPLSQVGADAGEDQLDLRRAGRDRRHQHGVARHPHARHPQGHPPFHGLAPGEAAQGDRHHEGHGAAHRRPGARRGPAAGGAGRTGQREDHRADGGQPPRLDLRRSDRRGLVGRVQAWQAARVAAARRGLNLDRCHDNSEKRRRFKWHC